MQFLILVVQRTKQETAWNAATDVWWHEIVDRQSADHTAEFFDSEHPIEKVGEKLRAMMPWIGKNKLVDKSKN